jgi:SAM-dependent methyltransferase
MENYLHKLPDTDFDTVISALSIHHLEDTDKKKLFSEIYKRLPAGGMFVNYDQFCAKRPEMEHWYNAYWESQLADSGLTKKDLELWRERRKLDKECTVWQEIDMLKQCGFQNVECVYSYQKFSVIAAIK